MHSQRTCTCHASCMGVPERQKLSMFQTPSHSSRPVFDCELSTIANVAFCLSWPQTNIHVLCCCGLAIPVDHSWSHSTVALTPVFFTISSLLKTHKSLSSLLTFCERNFPPRLTMSLSRMPPVISFFRLVFLVGIPQHSSVMASTEKLCTAFRGRSCTECFDTCWDNAQMLQEQWKASWPPLALQARWRQVHSLCFFHRSKSWVSGNTNTSGARVCHLVLKTRSMQGIAPEFEF